MHIYDDMIETRSIDLLRRPHLVSPFKITKMLIGDHNLPIVLSPKKNLSSKHVFDVACAALLPSTGWHHCFIRKPTIWSNVLTDGSTTLLQKICLDNRAITSHIAELFEVVQPAYNT